MRVRDQNHEKAIVAALHATAGEISSASTSRGRR
jgi:hypothetical protein